MSCSSLSYWFNYTTGYLELRAPPDQDSEAVQFIPQHAHAINVYIALRRVEKLSPGLAALAVLANYKCAVCRARHLPRTNS
jgi:hypothetical protein